MKYLTASVALAALLSSSAALAQEITVWADAVRQPAVEAFQATHPEITVNLIVDDGSSGASGTFQTKIALADQAGEGWPDVVFSTQNNDAAWAARETNGMQAFAQVLNEGFLDEGFLDGFTPGALDPVTVDGKVYGLRNDLAPVLFWYNDKLLKEFGYDVPQTWEEYQALGDMLAADHPGYFLGAIGDAFEGPYIYYWSGQAPIFQLDGNTFSSDTSDANAMKVSNLIDHMVANGTLTLDSLFGANFVATADKLVAIPGAAWYAGALFQNPGGVNADPGEWGAAPPLKWADGDAVTGNVGGGVWYASSHTDEAEAVKTFLQFVTTENGVAGTGGLPAYQAAAEAWLDEQAKSGFYAGDFKAAILAAASSVWDGWGYPNFSPETAWAKIVTPGLASGKTMVELSPAWEQEMKNEAQVVGYDVE